MRPERPALADVANLAGYYDQAHLNRDFRRDRRVQPDHVVGKELPISSKTLAKRRATHTDRIGGQSPVR